MSLKVEHISYSYDRNPVLDDVSFEADTGEVLALLGPNGIGKTTLLKAFSRILDPQDGHTWIDGQDIFGMNPASMFCDRFLFLRDHQVFAFGNGREVLTEENLLKVYGVRTRVTREDGCSHIRLLRELP